MTQPLTAGLAFHQVDAFSRQAFAGNPAAVYVLEDWLDESRLQAIAAEHNLSETAFFVPESASGGHIRWFTPTCEVALCGHATLATAHVLLTEHTNFAAPLVFTTEQAGELVINQADGQIWLDLPADPPRDCPESLDALAEALGAAPADWQVASNYLAIYERPDQVAALTPDMPALARALAGTDRGVIVTAPADDETDADFVSRYFVPGHGVDEDPVTGSAHCTLAPYWGARLSKDELIARQISARGGRLDCRLGEGRVHVGGPAVTVAAGTLFIDTHEVIA